MVSLVSLLKWRCILRSAIQCARETTLHLHSRVFTRSSGLVTQMATQPPALSPSHLTPAPILPWPVPPLPLIGRSRRDQRRHRVMALGPSGSAPCRGGSLRRYTWSVFLFFRPHHYGLTRLHPSARCSYRYLLCTDTCINRCFGMKTPVK